MLLPPVETPTLDLLVNNRKIVFGPEFVEGSFLLPFSMLKITSDIYCDALRACSKKGNKSQKSSN